MKKAILIISFVFAVGSVVYLSPSFSSDSHKNPTPPKIDLEVDAATQTAYTYYRGDCSTSNIVMANGIGVAQGSASTLFALFPGYNNISVLNGCGTETIIINSLSENNTTDELYSGPADLTVFRSGYEGVILEEISPQRRLSMQNSVLNWSQNRQGSRSARWERFKTLVGGDSKDARKILGRYPIADDEYEKIVALSINSLVSINIEYPDVSMLLVFDESIFFSFPYSNIGKPPSHIAKDITNKTIWSVLLVETNGIISPIGILNLQQTLEAIRLEAIDKNGG